MCAFISGLGLASPLELDIENWAFHHSNTMVEQLLCSRKSKKKEKVHLLAGLAGATRGAEEPCVWLESGASRSGFNPFPRAFGLGLSRDGFNPEGIFSQYAGWLHPPYFEGRSGSSGSVSVVSFLRLFPHRASSSSLPRRGLLPPRAPPLPRLPPSSTLSETKNGGHLRAGPPPSPRVGAAALPPL